MVQIPEAFIPVLESMSDEDAGMLIKVILRGDNELPEGCDHLLPVFSAYQQILAIQSDLATAKSELSAKRADAGRKGGFAKSEATRKNVAKRSKVWQNVANSGKSVAKSGKVWQNVANCSKNTEKEEAPLAPSPAPLAPPLPPDPLPPYNPPTTPTIPEEERDWASPSHDGAPFAIGESAPVDARFERFWSAYPKKVGKGAVKKIWAKLKPSEALLAKMIAAIEKQKQSAQWQSDGGQFIPMPSTWLNQERWEDEIPAASPSKAPPGQGYAQRTITDDDFADGFYVDPFATRR